MRLSTLTSIAAPIAPTTSAAPTIDAQKPATLSPKRLVRLYATYTPSI